MMLSSKFKAVFFRIAQFGLKLINKSPGLFDKLMIFWLPAGLLCTIAMYRMHSPLKIAPSFLPEVVFLELILLWYLTKVKAFELTSCGKKILSKMKKDFKQLLISNSEIKNKEEKMLLGVALFGKCYFMDDSFKIKLENALSATVIPTERSDKRLDGTNG